MLRVNDVYVGGYASCAG